MRVLTRTSIALVLGFFLTGAMWAQTTDQDSTPQQQNPAPQQMGPGGQMGPGAMGPGHMGPHHRGQRGFDSMAQQLNLTDQQKTQMQSLMQTQRQQAQAVRQDTSLTPEQRQQKMQELRQSTHSQMMGILTPEQQQKWQQLRSERMQRGWKGRGGKGPGAGMAALNLTPEQKSQIDPIRKSTHDQVMAVRNDSSLTPEQKQAKIRDIRQNGWSQINSILTPEQQQQWQQMKQRRRGPGGPQSAAPPSGF